MSGRKSRDKGARQERAVVKFLQDRGFAAEKISGMYKSGPDLTVPVIGRDLVVEVKVRVGDHIAVGQVIGTVAQPSILERIRVVKSQLAEATMPCGDKPTAKSPTGG